MRQKPKGRFKIDWTQVLSQLVGGIITLIVAFGVVYTNRYYENKDKAIERNNDLIRNMQSFTFHSINYFENNNEMQLSQIQQKNSLESYSNYMFNPNQNQIAQNSMFWLLQDNSKRVDGHEYEMRQSERKLEEFAVNIAVI